MGQIPGTAGGAGGFPPSLRACPRLSPSRGSRAGPPIPLPPASQGPGSRAWGHLSSHGGVWGHQRQSGGGLEGTWGCPWGPAAAAGCCFQPQSTAGASNIWPVAMGLQRPTGIWGPVAGWDAGSRRSPCLPRLPSPFFPSPVPAAGGCCTPGRWAGPGALPAGAAGSTGSSGSSRLSRVCSQPRRPPGRVGGHGRIPEPVGAMGGSSRWWSRSSSQPSGGLWARGENPGRAPPTHPHGAPGGGLRSPLAHGRAAGAS